MAELTPSQKELYKKLHEEFGLKKEHFYQHKHYTIITRPGIDLIQAKSGVSVEYEVVVCEEHFVVLKAHGVLASQKIQTFGSACKDNCQSAYKTEMAEKRAMARAVLKLVGLYSEGAFSEDEFTKEDLQESKAKARSDGRKASY